MTLAKLATLLVLALLPLGSMMAAEVVEAPEVIVVTGRLPGPPLWKVSNGDKVLWIFPYLDWIPKDMVWESERVARVIAQAQEVLSLPQFGWILSTTLLVRLNPVTIARDSRLQKQLERNPDGGTLEQNLPPELYARFSALQARYFPGNDGLVEMRPLFAGQTMMNNIRKREGLVSGDEILKKIQRLVRRNRDIKRTEFSASTEIDSYGEYADRLEAVFESFPPEQEQACFEQQIRQGEDLDEMKSRANNWAQGYIDEFRNVPLVFDELNACSDLFMGSSSPEQESLIDRSTRLNQLWLDAAENALATNTSTFAILPINELLAEDGMLSKLKAKGYEISEP